VLEKAVESVMVAEFDKESEVKNEEDSTELEVSDKEETLEATEEEAKSFASYNGVDDTGAVVTYKPVFKEFEVVEDASSEVGSVDETIVT